MPQCPDDFLLGGCSVTLTQRLGATLELRHAGAADLIEPSPGVEVRRAEFASEVRKARALAAVGFEPRPLL